MIRSELTQKVTDLEVELDEKSQDIIIAAKKSSSLVRESTFLYQLP